MTRQSPSAGGMSVRYLRYQHRATRRKAYRATIDNHPVSVVHRRAGEALDYGRAVEARLKRLRAVRDARAAEVEQSPALSHQPMGTTSPEPVVVEEVSMTSPAGCLFASEGARALLAALAILAVLGMAGVAALAIALLRPFG